MQLKSLLIIPLALGLSGCFGDDDDVYAECSIPDANQQLFEYMKEDYFWYQDLPSKFNEKSHDDIKYALHSLRAPQDRFSFAMTTAEYEDYQNSVFFGYGFSHTENETKDGLLVRWVFDEGSAAVDAGLRRGYTITEVNGRSAADIIADVESGNNIYSNIFGPNTDGYTINIKYITDDGTEVEASMSKGSIVANTVMATQVKTLNVGDEEKKVGYVVFDSFDTRSEDELNVAFDMLADEQVDEMVLDVRYNGGGLIRVANQLSTQIAGDNVENQEFVNFVHNDKQSQNNSTWYFELGKGIQKLNLDRVVVLTTGASCSSSELVINALDPFVDVVTIGEPTCGKPVGMSPEPICDHVVFAINFQTQNAVGFGDYFDGLPVDCPVNDKVTGDWGVETDPLLAEGLHYLSTGSCSSGAQGLARDAGARGKLDYKQPKPVDFSEGPIKAKRFL